MKKKGFIILGIVIVLLVVLLDSVTPKEIIWDKTYNENKTNPFDVEVFYDQLEAIFKDDKIITIKKTFYEYYQENYEILYEKNSLYINIDEQYNPDETSTTELLNFIGQGNIAFISANSFSKKLLDSLHLKKHYKTKNIQSYSNLKLYVNKKTDTLTIEPKLKYYQPYFKDSIPVKSIGKVQFKSNNTTINHLSNFIEIPYKNGVFYLHTQPEIFTNYYLLEIPNTKYIDQVLSQIPTSIKKSNQFKSNGSIYFESNYKGDPDLENSPLRFIKKQKELYAAFLIILVGVALFILINAKRKQRIIPIIPKVRNTSLDFIETISNLYEEADDFQPMVHHKINIFFKSIREQYNLVTDNTNEKLAKQLSLKSGYDADKTKELIRFINTLKNRESSSIVLLQKLNKKIEDFNKTTNSWMN